MSASPYRRIWMTSGQKVANHLTRAVPGTHGRDAGLVARRWLGLGWLPRKAGAGLVAPGWLQLGRLARARGHRLGWRPSREG